MQRNKIALKLVYHANKLESSKTMLLIIIAPFTTKEGIYIIYNKGRHKVKEQIERLF